MKISSGLFVFIEIRIILIFTYDLLDIMIAQSHFKRLTLCLTFTVFALQIYAQQKATYWIEFKDKANTQFSVSKPNEYLSLRAINRRKKNYIDITENDLPVSKVYVDSIQRTGARVLYTSKWFNAVTIEVNDETIISTIKNISFVTFLQKTKNASNVKSNRINTKNKTEFFEDSAEISPANYGQSLTQINQLNGLYLHNKGYKGSSVIIALIDAGYLNANKYKTLSRLFLENRILSSHDFVKTNNDIYKEHMHGAVVLSSIAANLEDTLIGTAPDASFILLRGEDSDSEFPVECDNWIAAAEYADSCGADIISSSLGYRTFDDSTMNFSYQNMNGKIIRSSIAAEIASSKGMIVVASAGNDGNKPWHYIGSPADAKEILSVGAINPYTNKTAFSSFGPSADGRIKPEVMALGESVIVEISPGEYSTINGTSLSCPIVAGLVACLVQAFPFASAIAIRQAVLESSSQYSVPDNLMGYGIPNFEKAYEILKDSSKLFSMNAYAFPNPFSENVTIVNTFIDEPEITIECYSIIGQKIFSLIRNGGYIHFSNEILSLEKGSYFFRCISKNKAFTIKAIKM